MEISEGNGSPSSHQLAGTGGGEYETGLKGGWGPTAERDNGQRLRRGNEIQEEAKSSGAYRGSILDED